VGEALPIATRRTVADDGTLDHHFVGKSPLVRHIFDQFLAMVESFGPVEVLPEKSRIAFTCACHLPGLRSSATGWSDTSSSLARFTARYCSPESRACRRATMFITSASTSQVGYKRFVSLPAKPMRSAGRSISGLQARRNRGKCVGSFSTHRWMAWPTGDVSDRSGPTLGRKACLSHPAAASFARCSELFDALWRPRLRC
jgi:hypothetical protein